MPRVAGMRKIGSGGGGMYVCHGCNGGGMMCTSKQPNTPEPQRLQAGCLASHDDEWWERAAKEEVFVYNRSKMVNPKRTYIIGCLCLPKSYCLWLAPRLFADRVVVEFGSPKWTEGCVFGPLRRYETWNTFHILTATPQTPGICRKRKHYPLFPDASGPEGAMLLAHT